MKILLVSYTADVHHGWGNITHELSLALKAKGIDFTLFLPKDEPHYDSVAYPVEYVLPSYTHTFRRFSARHYLFYKLDQRFKGYTLIHNLFDFPYCYIAYRLSRQLGIPYLTGSQGTYGVLPLFRPIDRFFQEKSYNSAKRILTPSRYTADIIQQHSRTKTPFQVIHNGVNYSRFSSPVAVDQIRKIREAYPGKQLLLGVGGLKIRKGFQVVIRALKYLKHLPLVYLIVGKGVMEKELRALAQTEGVEENVFFLGQKEGEELVAYFQSADLYCHTPVNEDFHFEGFGIVYLEANAAGKPVVASISGGVPDAVSEGQSGLLVPENEPEQTAQAIEQLLRDRQKYEEMCRGAQKWSEEHDWSRIAEQFIQVYEEFHS